MSTKRKSMKIIRLPSKSSDTTSYPDGTSCPNSPSIKKVFRLVMIGSARAGKTALVNRFINKGFDERYLPTIENFHRKLYKVRGEVYQLDILDRSGNDPFPASRKLSYISGDAFLCVSSVDHAQSVDQMFEIYNQIIECKSTNSVIRNWPILFVLNKTDLPKAKWQVELEEVQEKVRKFAENDDMLITCSAAKNEDVDKVFGRIFQFAKLPKALDPSYHKILKNENSADAVLTGRKKPVLQRMRSKFSKDDESEVIIDADIRRPSLRTDLLLQRARSVKHDSHSARKSESTKEKCVIS